MADDCPYTESEIARQQARLAAVLGPDEVAKLEAESLPVQEPFRFDIIEKEYWVRTYSRADGGGQDDEYSRWTIAATRNGMTWVYHVEFWQRSYADAALAGMRETLNNPYTQPIDWTPREERAPESEAA
ncbi:MAG: hypothetical protein ACRECF_03680 [Methyloceanibacter sp.]